MNEITIGKLAKKIGINPSAVRYYEQIGLLPTAERTDSGYRVYSPESETILKFIIRAQRLGFSLNDIKQLLVINNNHPVDLDRIIQIIKKRTLEIEKAITQTMVLRHEMGSFLQEVSLDRSYDSNISGDRLFQSTIDKICNMGPFTDPEYTLSWLYDSADCLLTNDIAARLLEPLQGLHFHIWQENDTYHILVISKDPEVYQVLEELANLEKNCQLHQHHHGELKLSHFQNGFLLTITGVNAFLYPRLFLDLRNQ